MENKTQIIAGSLFFLEPRKEIEAHISALFPHWDGGSVIVTNVKETRLFKANSVNSAGTYTLVEFLFRDRIYSEGIDDFAVRATLLSTGKQL
jgi:hypothetical protein